MSNVYISGVSIKFEIHILPPPPFLSYIFSPDEMYYKKIIEKLSPIWYKTFICPLVFVTLYCILFFNSF